MFPPAWLTCTRTITLIDPTSGMTRPPRRRHSAHQDCEVMGLRTGPGLVMAIAPANTASTTTHPVRWRCLAHHQDQGLTSLKAGSGPENRAGLATTTRPAHSLAGTRRRRQRTSTQALTTREHRSKHCRHFFRHQPTRATNNNTTTGARRKPGHENRRCDLRADDALGWPMSR
jgi:hypothetical protein